ncbi:MAG: proline racemase family protein, partial [Gammaproteobacteria bacterium]|nr:proline racemase family protein [Gammaproteobacteria bacterium]
SHAMSGSNAICVTTVLLETGMLEMVEPITEVTLDTPAGLVKANAHCKNGKVTSVDLDFFASFCDQLDVPVLVDGLGEVKVDTAFGGVYYILVDVSQLNFRIEPANAQLLVKAGNQILRAAQQQLNVQHPVNKDFKQIEFCMFTDVENAAEHVYRNATIMPPGRLDRSPCGTGSAARLATMHARGEINIDEQVIMRSAIGSRFSTLIRNTTTVGDKAAVLPRITGRAWIYSIGQYGVDPDDPFPLGFTLSDTWGDGIDHEIPDL